MKRSTLLASLALLTLAVGQPAVADTLKKPGLDALAAAAQASPPADFDAFLSAAAKADPRWQAVSPPIESTPRCTATT